MKKMPRKMVTVRKQTKAVIGYATAIFSDMGEFGIVGASKASVERFMEANFPHVDYSHRRTKRAVVMAASKVSTWKPVKQPKSQSGCRDAK